MAGRSRQCAPVSRAALSANGGNTARSANPAATPKPKPKPASASTSATRARPESVLAPPAVVVSPPSSPANARGTQHPAPSPGAGAGGELNRYMTLLSATESDWAAALKRNHPRALHWLRKNCKPHNVFTGEIGRACSGQVHLYETRRPGSHRGPRVRVHIGGEHFALIRRTLSRLDVSDTTIDLCFPHRDAPEAGWQGLRRIEVRNEAELGLYLKWVARGANSQAPPPNFPHLAASAPPSTSSSNSAVKLPPPLTAALQLTQNIIGPVPAPTEPLPRPVPLTAAELRARAQAEADALELEAVRVLWERAQTGQASLGVVAVDVLRWELERSVLLEVGWSTVQLDRLAGGGAAEEQRAASHAVLAENANRRNHYHGLLGPVPTVAKREKFAGGPSIEMSLARCAYALDARIARLAAAGPVLLLAHEPISTLSALAQLGLPIRSWFSGLARIDVRRSNAGAGVVFVLDTQRLWALSTGNKQRIPLGAACKKVGAQTYHLGNAGNGAQATLDLFVAIMRRARVPPEQMGAQQTKNMLGEVK